MVERRAARLIHRSHELLAHLERHACNWAPRYLGQDTRGRDILTYIPGTTLGRSRFTDAQIQAAVTIVRQLHDLTRGSQLAPSSVICHNDAAPNNFIFANDMPVALIDFDLASPGDPLEDLGYMGWAWCVSSKPERGPVASQGHQLRVLADAYGLSRGDRSRLPEWIIERQVRNVRFWSDLLAEPGRTPTSPRKGAEIIAWSEREARYVADHRAEFEAALL